MIDTAMWNFSASGLLVCNHLHEAQHMHQMLHKIVRVECDLVISHAGNHHEEAQLPQVMPKQARSLLVHSAIDASAQGVVATADQFAHIRTEVCGLPCPLHFLILTQTQLGPDMGFHVCRRHLQHSMTLVSQSPHLNFKKGKPGLGCDTHCKKPTHYMSDLLTSPELLYSHASTSKYLQCVNVRCMQIKAQAAM